MRTFNIPWLGLGAGLALLACKGPSSVAQPIAVPADSMPNAVADDDHAVPSMSEGGVSTQPYTIDGTVQQVTGRSVLIRSDEVGTRQVLVNRHTDIALDGHPAALSDVRPGMRVRAAYGSTGVAYSLQAGEGATPRDDRRG